MKHDAQSTCAHRQALELLAVRQARLAITPALPARPLFTHRRMLDYLRYITSQTSSEHRRPASDAEKKETRQFVGCGFN